MAVFRRLGRALDELYLVAGYLAAACLAGLGCLVLASVVTRLMSVYVGWLGEYAGYAMAAASFLAFAHTLRSGEQIRVGILLGRLEGVARRVVQLWCLVAATAISCWFAWYMVRLAMTSYRFGDRSEGTAATLLWIPQTPVAVGAVILAVAFAHSLIEAIVLGRSGISEPEEQGGETATSDKAAG
jgi:TRAP-type C4-dicarboxylate transport system permease small subunit